ncbi:MAG: hypothetical protein CL681_07420 [Blastopirellula sp.]|nr:hypothetical protein [Blastopirellula sp.]
MRHHWRNSYWILPLLAALCGCRNNPYFAALPSKTVVAQQPPAGAPTVYGTPPAVTSQSDSEKRIAQLDADNRDLQAQLAQVQQERQLLNDELKLVKRQLVDTASQVTELRSAKDKALTQVEGMLASTRKVTPTIRANNSLQSALQTFSLPGADVRQEQDVIRIALPSDQLFVRNTAQLQAGGIRLLDQVAAQLTQLYPNQHIGIEGHTDNAQPFGGATHHQLADIQAQAVFNHFTQRNQVPTVQLMTVAHGANHPRAPNSTAAGRSQNRRIEVVVYPETVTGR